MKYVIFEEEKSGLLHPILFGEHTTHSQVKLEGCKPISAGFWRMEGIYPKVWGNSESLKLEADVERDAELIFRVLLDMGTASFIQFDE